MQAGITAGVTTLCCMDGLTIHRALGSIWIEADPWVDSDIFASAIRLLGVTGRTDYEIDYDPGTGKEVFIFHGEINDGFDAPGQMEHDHAPM